MSEAKGDKMRQKRKPSKAKRLRDAAVVAMSIEGKTNAEIAKEVGLGSCQVSRILNSKETESLVKTAESRVSGLIAKAVSKVEAVIDQELDLSNGLKAALAVLKSTGVMKDKVSLEHHYPKPTIIHRRDGSQVILGVETDSDT